MKTENKWSYCPECGDTNSVHIPSAPSANEQACNSCGQIWFTHIDYTETVKANLAIHRRKPFEKPEYQKVEDTLRAASEADKARLREVEAERDSERANTQRFAEQVQQICEALGLSAACHFRGILERVKDLKISEQNAESDRRRLEEATEQLKFTAWHIVEIRFDGSGRTCILRYLAKQVETQSISGNGDDCVSSFIAALKLAMETMHSTGDAALAQTGEGE